MRNELAGATALGDNLRELRLARGITAHALGEATGIAATAITGIERGKVANPGVYTLYAIATTLGVRLEDLMGVQRVEHTTKGRTRARDWVPTRQAAGG